MRTLDKNIRRFFKGYAPMQRVAIHHRRHQQCCQNYESEKSPCHSRTKPFFGTECSHHFGRRRFAGRKRSGQGISAWKRKRELRHRCRPGIRIALHTAPDEPFDYRIDPFADFRCGSKCVRLLLLS